MHTLMVLDVARIACRDKQLEEKRARRELGRR